MIFKVLSNSKQGKKTSKNSRGFYIHLCFPFSFLVPASLVTPLGSAFLLPKGGLAWKSIIPRAGGRGNNSPGQRGVPGRTAGAHPGAGRWKLSPSYCSCRDWRLGKAGGSPGWCRSRAAGGAVRPGHRTWDREQEDGMSLPGAAAAPQARERFSGGISWGSASTRPHRGVGLSLGMHRGDVVELGGICSLGNPRKGE